MSRQPQEPQSHEEVQETQEETAIEQGPLQKGPLALLATTHGLNDAYVAFLSPLLPLLMDKFQVSLALAGVLATVLSISTNAAQPLFGYLADRNQRAPFIYWGPVISALAFSMLGVLPSYLWLIPALVVGGLSTAAFHPQAGSLVPQVGGDQRGLAMSLFISGGTLGYALGPVIVLSWVSVAGLSHTWILAAPALVAVPLLYFLAPRTVQLHQSPRSIRQILSDLRERVSPLSTMFVVVVLRSVTALSMSSFIAVYLVQVRHLPQVYVGLAMFLYLGAGAAGAIVASHLADRTGRRQLVILFGLLLGVPAVFGLVHVGGLLIWPMLVLSGACIQSTNPVLITMAQDLLPRSRGLAASIMMGAGFALASLFMPLVGSYGEAAGIAVALSHMSWLLLVAAAVALLLPAAVRQAGQAQVLR